MNAIKILSRTNKILNYFPKSLLNSTSTCIKIGLTQSNPVNLFSSWCGCFSNSLTFNKLTITPLSPVIIPTCGIKVKAKLTLRCKNCYFERRDGKMYVSCTSYPRHKQVALSKREKYTWIISHCTQSKKRPY